MITTGTELFGTQDKMREEVREALRVSREKAEAEPEAEAEVEPSEDMNEFMDNIIKIASAAAEAETEPQTYLADANIFEVNEKTFITLEIPGFNKDDIDAFIQEGILFIQGSKPAEETVDVDMTEISSEFPVVNKFENKFALGSRTSISNIKVKDGICKISLETAEIEKEYLEVS